ncbi:helix-turn-helix domain-containing protein [Pigmentibacter ruber]
MQLKELVKQMRLDAGLTERKAADIIRKKAEIWKSWEIGKRRPSLEDLRIFCEETQQDFNEVKRKYADTFVENKLKHHISSNNEKDSEDVFFIADKITNDILFEKNETRFSSKFCKLEHIDGSILITRWGSNFKFPNTKYDANIQLVNLFKHKLLNGIEIKKQIIIFLYKCKELGLELNYGIFKVNSN